MNKKKLWTLYLDLEQAERLKKLSEETRVPQAVYIREAIDLVLNGKIKMTKEKTREKNGKRWTYLRKIAKKQS